MKYQGNVFHLLIPLIQVAFYITMYELANYSAHRMGWVYSRGVAWGISAQVYAISYMAIIVLSNFISYFFPRKLLLIAIISSIIFCSYVLPVLDSYPFRGSTVMAIGVTGIFINYLFFRYRSTTIPRMAKECS